MTDEQFDRAIARVERMIKAIEEMSLILLNFQQSFSLYEVKEALKGIITAIFLCAIAIIILAISYCTAG